MKNFISFFIATFLIAFTMVSYGQANGYPEIGKPLPDFTFEKVEDYRVDQITNYDLKGRYTILDFWNIGCGGCVTSMPKMNELQKQFRNELDIILVGQEWRSSNIHKVYKKLKSKHQLNLISVFDSIYFRKLVPNGVPHVIWINKEGIVKAITTTREATVENVRKFISDKDFPFEDRSYLGMKKSKHIFNSNKPMLLSGNGGADTNYLFRSILARWHPAMGSGALPDVSRRSGITQNLFQAIKINVDQLYKLAYFGTVNIKNKGVNSKIVLNVKDSSIFIFDNSGKGLYSYSIELPPELMDEDRVMNCMQQDLWKFFGFDVSIIYQNAPYLAFLVTDSLKMSKMLKSVNSSAKNLQWRIGSPSAFANVELRNLLNSVKKFLPDDLYRYSLYNETNIKDDTIINMEFNADLEDLDSIRKGVQKFGFDIQIKSKPMKTLVISDPKTKISKTK